MLKKTIFIALGLIMLSCNSSDDSENQEETNSNNYIYFMSGKIDGVPFIYGQKEEATTLSYQLVKSTTLSAVCAYYPETGGFNYDLSVYPNFDNDHLPSAGINFVRFHLCTDSESQLETFNNKFPLRNYGFAISASSDSGPTGDIAITYAANAVDGPYYSSAGVEQTNGAFEITKSTPLNTYVGEVLWRASQIVEGTFSVTLKNLADENDIIQITDGEFKMIPSM